MTTALVTGGAGFIGSNVVALLLAEGYEVVVLDSFVTGSRQNLPSVAGLRVVEGDVRNAELVSKVMAGVETVFHLAASVGNVRSIERPLEDSEVNILGTLCVLEAARGAGVRKLVTSSSSAIFGELKSLPISEDHPAEPDSPYGVSKLAQEKHCLAYSRLYELEVICLRYFNVYGVNQRCDAYGNAIPIFATHLLRGDSITVFGDGKQTRDFVNVRDVAQANLLAAQVSGISSAFNIASGEATTVIDLVEMMGELCGQAPKVVFAPPRKGEVRHSRAAIHAARKVLGYAPTVGLIEGLKEYLEWTRAEIAHN